VCAAHTNALGEGLRFDTLIGNIIVLKFEEVSPMRRGIDPFSKVGTLKSLAWVSHRFTL
jgi:hypothetical protein